MLHPLQQPLIIHLIWFEILILLLITHSLVIIIPLHTWIIFIIGRKSLGRNPLQDSSQVVGSFKEQDDHNKESKNREPIFAFLFLLFEPIFFNRIIKKIRKKRQQSMETGASCLLSLKSQSNDSVDLLFTKVTSSSNQDFAFNSRD
jgi:hypothetical protein